jgi:hypothetical protein
MVEVVAKEPTITAVAVAVVVAPKARELPRPQPRLHLVEPLARLADPMAHLLLMEAQAETASMKSADLEVGPVDSTAMPLLVGVPCVEVPAVAVVVVWMGGRISTMVGMAGALLV